MIAYGDGIAFSVDDCCRDVHNGGSAHGADAHNTPNIVIVEQPVRSLTEAAHYLLVG